jgi:ribosomal protein S18 acetylase RimI-like enzyme
MLPGLNRGEERMDQITFRKARPGEFETILLLLKQALWLKEKKVDHSQEWIAPPPNFVNWTKRGFDQGEFYMVERGGVVAGCFRLQWREEQFLGTGEDRAEYVHPFTVSRDLEGQGLGYRILGLIESHCKEKSKQLLRLDCAAENMALRNYYEGFGFRAVGEVTVYSRLTLYEKWISPAR